MDNLVNINQHFFLLHHLFPSLSQPPLLPSFFFCSLLLSPSLLPTLHIHVYMYIHNSMCIWRLRTSDLTLTGWHSRTYFYVQLCCNLSDFLPTELDAGDLTTIMKKDSKGNIFLSPSGSMDDGKSGMDWPMGISSWLPCLEGIAENSLFSFTYNRVLRCTGFKVCVTYTAREEGSHDCCTLWSIVQVYVMLFAWCVYVSFLSSLISLSLMSQWGLSSRQLEKRSFLSFDPHTKCLECQICS